MTLVMLLPLAGAQCVSAQSDPIAKFPFHVESGLAFIDAKVNGVPVRITMDTGAPGIVLDASLAEPARIKLLKTSENDDISVGRLDSLSIGSFVVRNQQVRVQSFGAVNDSASGRPPVLGVIGTAFFRQFVTELDFANHIVSLYMPDKFSYGGSGVAVPITFKSELPLVTAMIGRDGRDSIPARLIIDLGSANAPVALTSRFAQSVQLFNTGDRFVEVAGITSLYGTGTGRVQRVASVKLGDLTITRPTVNISDALGAAIPPVLADGTIGMPVLRRTTLILDYSRSRIIFEKNSEFDSPYEFANVSGLQLGRVGNTIRVRNVIAGSPAADVGLRNGDEILRVDGAPVPTSGSVNLPPLREPNTTHRLSIRRGRDTMSVAITLRRLI